MLNIKKEYKNGYIVYNFTGSTGNQTLEDLTAMLKKDIKQTYMFMFNFKSLDYLNVDAIQMLQKIYIMR